MYCTVHSCRECWKNVLSSPPLSVLRAVCLSNPGIAPPPPTPVPMAWGKYIWRLGCSNFKNKKALMQFWNPDITHC